jgi:LysM repeat protein
MFLVEIHYLGTIFASLIVKAVHMKMNKIPLLLAMFFLLPLAAYASDGRQAIYNYIEHYKDIAIFEMERTGIPASIKMAQAILESNAGRSELAVQANNHFGIKCNGNWTGGTHYRKDDDRDSRGRLIESCFRAYGSAEESFIAHSDFLSGQDRRTRYGWLFDLDPYDYEAWAHGLQKSGYATNRRYGQLLINLIENYSLYELDRALTDPDYIANRPGTSEQIIPSASPGRQDENIFNNSGVNQRPRREFEINQLRVVKASAGENLADLALELQIPVRALLRFNEGVKDAFQPFPADRNVFLQPMRRAYRDGRNQHRVREDETMLDIALTYGVRLDQLYKRNRMDEGREPAVGQNIYLRGRRGRTDVVRYRPASSTIQRQAPPNEVPQPKMQKEADKTEELITHAAVGQNEGSVQTVQRSFEEVESSQRDSIVDFQEQTNETTEVTTHTVSAGETLFAISRMYGISVDQIISANNMESNVLSIGQVLRIR